MPFAFHNGETVVDRFDGRVYEISNVLRSMVVGDRLVSGLRGYRLYNPGLKTYAIFSQKHVEETYRRVDGPSA